MKIAHTEFHRGKAGGMGNPARYSHKVIVSTFSFFFSFLPRPSRKVGGFPVWFFDSFQKRRDKVHSLANPPPPLVLDLVRHFFPGCDVKGQGGEQGGKGGKEWGPSSKKIFGHCFFPSFALPPLLCKKCRILEKPLIKKLMIPHRPVPFCLAGASPPPPRKVNIGETGHVLANFKRYSDSWGGPT